MFNSVDNEESIIIDDTEEEKPIHSKAILIIALSAATILMAYALIINFLPPIMKDIESEAKTECNGYIGKTLPIMANSWSEEDFRKFASPELLESCSNKTTNLDQFLDRCSRKLGPIEEYDKEFVNYSANVNLSGLTKTASYKVDAEFEKGEGQININLIQHNGKWQYLDINIDSDAFDK